MSNKTGKIVAYQPNGEAEIKGMKYNRFLVTFADGQQWKFLAKGDFKKQIGDEVQYTIKNEQYKNAAFVVENNYNAPVNTPQNNNISMRATTNDSIILQVCYKENMSAFGKDNRDIVMKNTKEDFDQLKLILNNI
tara:strand:- start:317 stop:721 length:405 start_codon:yes stop_codon:yes gene_type:complete